MVRSVFPPHRSRRAGLPQRVPQADSLLGPRVYPFASSAIRLSSIGHTFSSSVPRVCGTASIRQPVHPFPPVGPVAAPDGSPAVPHLRRYYWPLRLLPTRPCHLRSPLTAGTPRRGSVRFPWDTLISLGTWFFLGWAEPGS